MTPAIEMRIAAASLGITRRGYELRLVDYCEDSETPGLLGYYAGVTNHTNKTVKVATKNKTRAEIADVLEHELHHVEDPEWDCGNRDVFGGGHNDKRRI